MVHGIIIPASDAQDMQAVELSELEDYQRAVGGWIEALDILGFGCTMYLNEEGLIRGLPYNRRATYLWWYHVLEVRGQARLAGDAVLVGLTDDGARAVDVPPRVQDLLLGSAPCQVEVQWLNSHEWRPAPSEPQSYIEARRRCDAHDGVRTRPAAPLGSILVMRGGGMFLRGSDPPPLQFVAAAGRSRTDRESLFVAPHKPHVMTWRSVQAFGFGRCVLLVLKFHQYDVCAPWGRGARAR